MDILQVSSDASSGLGAEAGLQTAEATLGSGALDSKRELHGCRRWPRWMRLLSSEGELVMGRCKATNLCPHCQRCYVRETVEALILDSIENPPTCWVVLTAAEHLTRSELSRHLMRMRESLRARGWTVEWFVQVEMQRRGALHANLLIKGCAGREHEFGADLLELWSRRPGVTTVPEAQYVGAIGAAVAVAKYCGKMLGHGLKREQAPPIGWRGHRTSHTRGYFAGGTAAARQRARESLQRKRALAIATDSGLGAHDAEIGVSESMRRDAAVTWTLTNLRGVRLTRARPVPVESQWELYRAIKERRLVPFAGAVRWRQWTGWDAADSLAEYRYRRASDEREPDALPELPTLF